jgi:signal transduction histidine kinase
MIARIIRPSSWPVVLKVPVLVALLMVAISVVLTDQVLKRLAESQERHFRELTAAYLDGLSSSVIPSVLRDDAWETFDSLDRSRSLYRGLAVVDTVVVGADGTVIASSNPRVVPTYTPLPPAIADRFAKDSDNWIDESGERAGIRRALVHQGRTIGAIYAQLDVGAQFQERRAVLWTLVGTNLFITAMVAVIGLLAVRRLLQPVRLLTRHLSRGQSGPLPTLSDHDLGSERSEFGRLFRRYNAMVRTWNEREAMAARMAEEDRLASLGRLASGMAHEINNPLGGLFNAIETLKRYGDHPGVRDRTISLLERGLAGIRDVVRSALVTYRAESNNRRLKPADIDDLRLLIEPEIVRRNLQLAWHNSLVEEMRISAGAIRQAVLNLLLNACQASPLGGRVRFDAIHTDNSLVIQVTDDGCGLDPDRARFLEDRELVVAPRPGESGLGLWIIRRLVAEVSGSIRAERGLEGGTTITLTIPDIAPEEYRNVA